MFLRDLERLLDRAQPGLARELRQQQLIDRFIAGLPESIGDQLYLLSPAGLNETVSKARELMLLQQRKEDRHRAKSHCTVAAASTSTTDQIEGQVKRNSSKDESLARPRSARKQRGTCFHCGEHGHWKRDCPVLVRQGTAANKTLGVLGTSNRAESYSLLVQASVGRQMVQCMVGTGHLRL